MNARLAWIAALGLALAPVGAHADDGTVSATEQTAPPASQAPAKKDLSIHGRRYDSHRQPGNHAFEGPGSWHGHPRHGFEIGTHWDRTWPPNGHPGFAAPGACAVGVPCGNVPWPLSNLDIEVQAE